jgi:hypothetical protein
MCQTTPNLLKQLKFCINYSDILHAIKHRGGAANVMSLQVAKPEIDKRQRGAVFVEATIALPFLLGIMFVTMLLLFFCFRILSFQYAMAEVTRETFSRDSTSRGGQTWQDYWTTQMGARTDNLGLIAGDIYGRSLGSAEVVFTNANCSTGWSCSQSAEPGDIFSVALTLTVPILPQNLGGISLPQIQFSSRTIAAIQMRESE